jgi:hypothetical protein
VLDTLEQVAQSEAGSSWPNGGTGRFQTQKEIISTLPYELADGEKGEHIIDIRTHWFSGQSNYNKAFLSQMTSYQVGLRRDVPITIEDIPQHHTQTVFEYFKSVDGRTIYAAAKKQN